MLNKLKKILRSILFFYITFFISNGLIVLGLSNITEIKNPAEKDFFTTISVIGALMLIVSVAVIFTPPIIKIKNILHAFILRKTARAEKETAKIAPPKRYYHFTFIENIIIFTTVIGIFFIGIIIYVLFCLFFKKIIFFE